MTNGKHVLYLLHFPSKVSGCQHYLGMSTIANLRKRLTRHLAGFGAGLTARAAFELDHMRLVALWSCVTPTDERRIKRGGHLKQYCSCCCGMARSRRRFFHQPNILLTLPPKPQALGAAKHVSFP